MTDIFHDAYASVVIERERLKTQLAALAAENERLRKAGDAFFDSVIGYYGEHILEDEKHSSGQMCRDWLAAKEGDRK